MVGTGSSIEYEADEAIEFENEQEKGGEVELEQFWLQKTFSRALNLRAGHIVVPFGLTNAHHEPLNFFIVYRPEGENTILPCTWHQTGVSLFGRIGKWSYNAENHIFTYRHYRIYKASFDTDNMGSYLSVNYDPWGITVTYIGYALLFLSLILLLILPGTPFCELLQSPLLQKGLFVLTLLTLTPQTKADNSDVQVNAPIVNKEVAENFGRLFINYNGRICPVQTFALDFTQKIYGNHRYRRLTAEQVLLSWIFYAPEWGNEPFIHVKNEPMREQLNLNEYSGLNAFFDADGYRLGPVVEEYNSGQHDSYHKACMDIDSKIQILMSLRTGSSLLMIPYKDNRDIKWYGPADALPKTMPHGEMLFAKTVFSMLFHNINAQQNDEANDLINKWRKLQVKDGGSSLPSPTQVKAELFYNSLPLSSILFMANLFLGLLCLGHINQMDPAIGYLMPVLNSPLLSIQVRYDHTASKHTNRCSQAPDCLQLYV